MYKLCEDNDKLINFHNDLIKLHEIIKNKEDYIKVVDKSNDDLLSFYYINKVFNIRPGLYPIGKTFDPNFKTFINAPIIDFIKNADITFSNIDGRENIKYLKIIKMRIRSSISNVV